MAAEQVAEDLARHAGCSPGRHIAGGHHTCVGKTGFFGDRVVLLYHGNFVAISGQLISRGHTNDAGT